MLLSLSLSLVMVSPALSDPAPSTGGGVPAQTIEQAHDVLDGEMSDYTRARFKDVRAVYVDATADHTGEPVRAIVFCGQVNAPNRIGGMTGWVPFYLRPDTVVFPFQTSPGFNPRLHPSCEPGTGTPVDDVDYAPALTYDDR